MVLMDKSHDSSILLTLLIQVKTLEVKELSIRTRYALKGVSNPPQATYTGKNKTLTF